MSLYTFYVEPGVYVKTIREISGVPLPSNLRLPILIGEAAETVPVANLAMIRASSATVDNYTKNEDVTERFLDANGNFITPDASSLRFKVRNTPIVTGSGHGTPSTDPGHVVVTINGQVAGVTRVQGEEGIVHLSQLTVPGDVVKISYYYDKRDTLNENEDLSFQVDGVKTVFKVQNARIVRGVSGGLTTNNVADIRVTVNGVRVTPVDMDGLSGTFTLAVAPPVGSDLRVTYYSNNFEDTEDPFPEDGIVSIREVGNNPGRVDFVDQVDYVLVDDHIVWGHAARTVPLLSSPGAGNEVFDTSQILTTLVDNWVYMDELTGVSDGTNLTFRTRGEVVDGSGRGRTTDKVSDITVYVGVDPMSALSSGPVAVHELHGRAGEVVLAVAPNSPNKVYATYAYNVLIDAQYDLTVVTPGAAGVGTYTLESPQFGSLARISEGAHSVADSSNFVLAGGIIYPTNIRDLQSTPGVSVTENVEVTFTSSTEYTVTSDNALGSSGTGSLNKTYLDTRTGLRFTILDPSTAAQVEPTTTVTNFYAYAAGDVLRFTVETGVEFTTGSSVEVLQIPGIRLIVTDTVNVPVGDSARISSFNKSGREPSVGSIYFVSYEFEKPDYDVKLASNEREVTILSGPINLANRLSLAARICLRNGALRVGLKQVKRAPNSATATDQDYIEAIIEQEQKLPNDRNQDIIVPLNGNPDVWGFLKAHVEKLSTEFYDRQRRIGIVGFNLGTAPEDAIPVVKSLNSERMWVVYPDGVIVSYLDELGRQVEAAVDGSYLAAAVAGLISSPSFDSATPLIGRDLVDFSRLIRRMDPFSTKDVITAGTIFLRDVGTAVRIVDAYTSRYGQLLFEEPNVTLIDDEIARDGKTALMPFIGQKSLSGLSKDMERAISRMMQNKVSRAIIADFKDVFAQIDPDDPRVGRVSVAYKPIFALKWIELTLFVRSNF